MPESYLMYSRPVAKTGKAIAEAIGVAHGMTAPEHPNILARWGSTTGAPWAHGLINRQNAVATATDKEATLIMFHDAGIPAPEILQDPAFPMLGRTRTHSRGRHAYFAFQPGDERRIDRDDLFWVRAIPKAREYRVHAWKGTVLGLQRKLYHPSRRPYDPMIWNHRTNWFFRDETERNTRRHIRCSQLGIEAVNAIGLDFGAVDIILSTEGEYFVLEVNTAPGLDTNLPLFARYVEAFKAAMT